MVVVMLVGIAGPIAAGKTTLAEKFRKKGFCVTSCSEVLRGIIRGEIKVPVKIDFPKSEERNALWEIGRKLRGELGDGALVVLGYNYLKDKGCQNIVIEGIRTRGEGLALLQLGGQIIYIDAPPSLRFKRLLKRKAEKDKHIKTYGDFVKADKFEWEEYDLDWLRMESSIILLNDDGLGKLEGFVNYFLEKKGDV